VGTETGKVITAVKCFTTCDPRDEIFRTVNERKELRKNYRLHKEQNLQNNPGQFVKKELTERVLRFRSRTKKYEPKEIRI
jgi:hypothetical protein